MRDFQEQASKYARDTFAALALIPREIGPDHLEIAFLKGVAVGLHHAAGELRELRDDIGKLTKEPVSSQEHTQ